MRFLRLAAAGLLALALGTLATVLIAWVLNLGVASAAAPAQTLRSLVVATAPISAGQVIDAQQLRLMPWPGDTLPPEAHTQIEKVAGRVARQTIPEGDLILEAKLAATDARAGLAATITLGKRAISVRVNDVVGVAGFALPGSYVDVLVSARDAAGQSFSKIVLERVKVLAAAQDTQADPNKPKVVNAVTLELAPAEAEALDLARAIGNLSLVLRNEADGSRAASQGTRVADIAGSRGTAEAGSVRATPVTIVPGNAAAPASTGGATAGPRRVAQRATANGAAPAGAVIEMRGLAVVENRP